MQSIHETLPRTGEIIMRELWCIDVALEKGTQALGPLYDEFQEQGNEIFAYCVSWFMQNCKQLNHESTMTFLCEHPDKNADDFVKHYLQKCFSTLAFHRTLLTYQGETLWTTSPGSMLYVYRTTPFNWYISGRFVIRDLPISKIELAADYSWRTNLINPVKLLNTTRKTLDYKPIKYGEVIQHLIRGETSDCTD